MESNDVIKTLHQDQRIIDLEYSEFYYQVTKRLIDFEDARSLRALKRYFQIAQPQRCYGNEVRDTGFSNPSNGHFQTILFYRAIQIFRSGPVMSSAVDFHVRNLFGKNRSLLNKILRNDVIRICSIGGRLPSDLVAVVSVLESIAKEKSVDLDIRVTVIETDDEWKNTCYVVLDCLEYFREHPWKTDFFSQDVLHLGKGRARAVLRVADIVTMTKFYSEFKDTPGDLSDALTEIGNVIKPGCLLFQLDLSKDNVINFFGGPSGTLENLKLIYEELCDLHALDPDAIEKSYRLYQNNIPKPYYSKFLNVFTRAWVKTAVVVGGLNEPLHRGKRSSVVSLAYLQQYGERFSNPEKYNPRQTFLSAKSFETWERRVKEEAIERHFSRLGTRKRIENEKTERNLMLVKLLEERKKLQLTEKRLTVRGIEESENEEWSKYLSEKRNFSAFKLKIYSYSLNLLTRRLERDEIGFAKKKRHGPRSVPLSMTEPGYSKMRFPD